MGDDPMAEQDQLLQDHRATYSRFVRLAFISSAVVAIALGLMAVFLL